MTPRNKGVSAEDLEAKATANLSAARRRLDKVEGAIRSGHLPVTSGGTVVDIRDILNREAQGPYAQYLTRTEVAVLDRHPELAWVVNGGPARPPTDEEKARYEGQRTSASFADLMAIQARAQAGEDEPLLPVPVSPPAFHELVFTDREARPAKWETRCGRTDVPLESTLTRTTGLYYEVSCPECLAASEPEPDVIEGEIVPDEAGLLEIQHDAEETLARWVGKPSDLHSVPALDADTAGMTAILPEAGQ
jgi:hypothetical protein